MKKVLILGGGFAGVQTAIELQKTKLFDVTLVSDRDYLYIYPISIWVPVRKINFENVKLPLKKIQHTYPFNLIIDSVLEIKSSENKVICNKHALEYDYLIIAIGTGKIQHKGIENTLSVCGNPNMAIALRDKLDQLIAKKTGKIAIGFGGNPKDKSAMRGGPAFEVLFNIHNVLKERKLREHFEITFFAPMEEPGARMGKDAMKLIYRMFEKCNINTRFGKKIKEFKYDSVVFEDDSILESDLIMFIPASSGHNVLSNSDLPLTDAGFIKIDNSGLVNELQNVYAIGDVAAIEGPEWIAKQGHIAELMGRNAAYNIIEAEKGSQKRKGYQEHLSILCVMDTGKGAAFVFRNSKKNFVIPLPIIGHWLKKAWGIYAKQTKIGIFPRLPGI